MQTARALVFSSVALVAGAGAHVSANGRLPSTAVLVVLVLLGAAAAAPFFGRRLSTWQVIGMLVAGQSAMHLALSAAAGHRGDPISSRTTPVAPLGSSADRHGSFYDVAYAPTTSADSAGLSVPEPLLHALNDMQQHPTMALAHLVAAVVCGLWLARGERALWLLVDLAVVGAATFVRRLVALAAILVTPVAVVRSVPVRHPERVRRSVSLVVPHSRRGPPVLAFS